MKQNACVYAVHKNGKSYLYMELTLDNGEVIKCAIRQTFYNNKLQYKITQHLGNNNEAK